MHFVFFLVWFLICLLYLVNMNIGESKGERTQWQLVAEKVMEDLVLAYERAKTEMEEHHHVLRLVARSGKIFFYG